MADYHEEVAGHKKCCGRCISYTGQDIDYVPTSFCIKNQQYVCGVCGTCDDFQRKEV
jgi:hypothetical protein